jgi:gas vesicle protein
MKSFLAGLGIGIGLGVLFAPMRGEDAREMLAVRASELADTARDQYDRAWDKTSAAIGAIREDQGSGTGTQG